MQVGISGGCVQETHQSTRMEGGIVQHAAGGEGCEGTLYCVRAHSVCTWPRGHAVNAANAFRSCTSQKVSKIDQPSPWQDRELSEWKEAFDELEKERDEAVRRACEQERADMKSENDAVQSFLGKVLAENDLLEAKVAGLHCTNFHALLRMRSSYAAAFVQV